MQVTNHMKYMKDSIYVIVKLTNVNLTGISDFCSSHK